jgi:hypothetical protein
MEKTRHGDSKRSAVRDSHAARSKGDPVTEIHTKLDEKLETLRRLNKDSGWRTWDRAMAYQELGQSLGLDSIAIAAVLGSTPAHVNDHLAIFDLSGAAQLYVQQHKGSLSSHVLRYALRAPVQRQREAIETLDRMYRKGAPEASLAEYIQALHRQHTGVPETRKRTLVTTDSTSPAVLGIFRSFRVARQRLDERHGGEPADFENTAGRLHLTYKWKSGYGVDQQASYILENFEQDMLYDLPEDS